MEKETLRKPLRGKKVIIFESDAYSGPIAYFLRRKGANIDTREDFELGDSHQFPNGLNQFMDDSGYHAVIAHIASNEEAIKELITTHDSGKIVIVLGRNPGVEDLSDLYSRLEDRGIMFQYKAKPPIGIQKTHLQWIEQCLLSE